MHEHHRRNSHETLHHHRRSTTSALIALLGLAGCGSSGSPPGLRLAVLLARRDGDCLTLVERPLGKRLVGGLELGRVGDDHDHGLRLGDLRHRQAGATVMVGNDDTEAHMVTADSSGGLDVEIAPGETAVLKAPAEGTCTYHSDMHGALVVSRAPGGEWGVDHRSWHGM